MGAYAPILPIAPDLSNLRAPSVKRLEQSTWSGETLRPSALLLGTGDARVARTENACSLLGLYPPWRGDFGSACSEASRLAGIALGTLSARNDHIGPSTGQNHPFHLPARQGALYYSQWRQPAAERESV